MAGPLIIKQPKDLGLAGQAAILVFIIAPIIAFIYCWVKHGGIHFEPPWLNLIAHVSLVVLPLVWACMISSTPMDFAESGEFFLGKPRLLGFLRNFLVDGWMASLTLAAPLFAAVTLIFEFFTKHLAHPENLTTGPGKALAIMGMTFTLGLFCATVFTGSSEPRALVSNAGLRTGIMTFHPWEDIDHIGVRGQLYIIYNRANAALPATSFEVRTDEARSVLERFLAVHQVKVSNAIHPQYILLRLGVLGAFAGLLGVCFWIRANTGISLLWITVGAVAAGVVLTLLLEQIRGVPKYRKHRPVMEPVG